jgi:surface antigen
LQRRQRCWKYFQLTNVVSFVVKIGIAAVFGLLLTSVACVPSLFHPNEVLCAPTDKPSNTAFAASAYSLPTEDSLSLMQAHVVDRRSTRWNAFPYGQCTWYANERYRQLHGVYVPWRMGANAWQWRARAAQFGWRVYARPIAGSILVLQPGVQGASRLGHVGVVESVNRDGSFIASSMNWAPYRWAVTRYRFFPGPGVSFISR